MTFTHKNVKTRACILLLQLTFTYIIQQVIVQIQTSEGLLLVYVCCMSDTAVCFYAPMSRRAHFQFWK